MPRPVIFGGIVHFIAAHYCPVPFGHIAGHLSTDENDVDYCSVRRRQYALSGLEYLLPMLTRDNE